MPNPLERAVLGIIGYVGRRIAGTIIAMVLLLMLAIPLELAKAVGVPPEGRTWLALALIATAFAWLFRLFRRSLRQNEVEQQAFRARMNQPFIATPEAIRARADAEIRRRLAAMTEAQLAELEQAIPASRPAVAEERTRRTMGP